jgi:hypothetical protein
VFGISDDEVRGKGSLQTDNLGQGHHLKDIKNYFVPSQKNQDMKEIIIRFIWPVALQMEANSGKPEKNMQEIKTISRKMKSIS